MHSMVIGQCFLRVLIFFCLSIILLMVHTHIHSLILPTDSVFRQKSSLPRLSTLFLLPHLYAFRIYMRVINIQVNSNQECVFIHTLTLLTVVTKIHKFE
jgi:hypothetical protein